MKGDGYLKFLLACALTFQCGHTNAVIDWHAPGPANVIVDLSRWNEDVNFTLAKADGIHAVMLRATRGLTYVDPKYEERMAAAKSEELLRGAYHFLEGEDGKSQAEHFLKEVGDDHALLLALDIEANNGGNHTMTAKQAEDFVTTVYEARRRYPLIYGNANFLKDFSTPLLRKCPLWIARWGESLTLPQGWNDWVMWQYTDGKVGPEPHTARGIGPCDRSKFNGTLWELFKFWLFSELNSKYVEIFGTRPNGIIDLPFWETRIFDFKSGKEDGILAATHRATGGLHITDSKYKENREAAMKSGILWGAIHNYMWGADAEKQADHFLKVAGGNPDTLRIVEFSLFSQQTDDKPPLADQAASFVNRIERATGRYPVLLAGHRLLEEIASPTLLRCPLWLRADAGSELSLPQVPKPWSDWVLWEYGSTNPYGPSAVLGVGICRRSAFNGTSEQLTSFWHGPESASASNS